MIHPSFLSDKFNSVFFDVWNPRNPQKRTGAPEITAPFNEFQDTEPRFVKYTSPYLLTAPPVRGSDTLVSLKQERKSQFGKILQKHLQRHTISDEEAQQILTQLEHLIDSSNAQALTNNDYIRNIFNSTFANILQYRLTGVVYPSESQTKPYLLMPPPKDPYDLGPLPRAQYQSKYHSQRPPRRTRKKRPAPEYTPEERELEGPTKFYRVTDVDERIKQLETMIAELDAKLIYLRQKRISETDERVNKLMNEYRDLKESLIQELYDEKRSVLAGVTEWENEERAKIYKYFKMHYENAKRFEEYGNRQRMYETQHLSQQKFVEEQNAFIHNILNQKQLIWHQQQMARDDLSDLLETAKREHFEKQKVQEYYDKYMEILDNLDHDFFNTMEAEEEERKAIEDAKFRLLSVKPHSATTPPKV